MGSRWREMLMDYGQILGDKSSGTSSSAFFTIDGDLDEKRNEELHLRRVLEIHFRPLFQQFVYGGEKIACHDLRRLLRDPEYRSRLPPDKVHELADLTDFNLGRIIRYDEFVRIVLGKPDDGSSFGSETGSSGSESRQGGPAMAVLRQTCRNTTRPGQINDRLSTYKYLPPPVFMIAVTIAQIVVFIVDSQEDGVSCYPLHNVYRNNTLVTTVGCNRAMYHPTRRHEAWRFFTYCFLHPGYVDLILNIIIQLLLGIPLEIIFSTWRVILVYFCGVVSGSLAQSVIDHHVGLTGAAGGAYAIMFAHLVGLCQNWKQLTNNKKQMTESTVTRILCSLPLRLVLMMAVFIPQVVIAGYRRWYYTSDYEGRVGIVAHVAGLVVGLLLGDAFLTDNRRYPWQFNSGWLNLFLFMAFLGFAIIFNIVYRGYPSEDYR